MSLLVPAPVDVVLYRGFGYDTFLKVLSKMVDNEVMFSNFISTSWSRTVANNFIGGGGNSKVKNTRGYIPYMRDCITCCMMKIIVPITRNEKEIIFDRYARFKLINIVYEEREKTWPPLSKVCGFQRCLFVVNSNQKFTKMLNF